MGATYECEVESPNSSSKIEAGLPTANEPPKTCWMKSKPYVICTGKHCLSGLLGALLALGILALVLYCMGLIGGSSGTPVVVVDLGSLQYPTVESDYTSMRVTMNSSPRAQAYDPQSFIIQTQPAYGTSRRLRTDSDGPWTDALTVDYHDNASSSGTIKGLSPGDGLVIRYFIKMSDGRTSSGSVAVVAFAKEASEPDSPSLESNTTSTSSVTVSVVPPSSDNGYPVTGYILEHAISGAATTNTNWTSSPISVEEIEKPFAVNGLRESQSVIFRVSAANQVGQSGTSKVYTMQTNSDDATKPGQVTGLSVAGVGPDYVNMNWTATAPRGAMVLRYEVTESGTSLVHRVDGSQTAINFGGLQRDTEYSFSVKALNSEGFGEESSPVTAKTKKYCDADPPSSVVPLTPFSDGISVRWSPPTNPKCDMPNTGYRVVEADSGKVLCEAKNGANWCDATGLESDTSYTVSVHAANKGGWSTLSSTSTRMKTLVTGPCTTRDQIRWWVSVSSPHYDAEKYTDHMASCAKNALGNADGVSRCLQDYTSDPKNTPFNLPKLSTQCTDCYGVNAQCAMQHCSSPCKLGSAVASAECLQCNAKYCKKPFFKCAGLYSAISPPDPTG